MKKLINLIRKFFILNLIVFIIIVITPFENIKASTRPRFFEFRGAWIATVSNIDIGKQFGSGDAAIESYKQQFLEILKVFEDYNLNAVIFQVRPLNDAFYRSSINPWSRFLIGQEGTDPGWDPLEWMIEEVHKRNMEFHAWMNPYRTSLDVVPKDGDYEVEKTAYLSTLDDKNFAKQHPELLVRGTHDKTLSTARLLLNPAKEEVRQHIYDTITEVINNYDVDAIHFDDYFYNGVGHNEDASDFNAYRQTGGELSKDDWRREQVNILIKGIHNLMKTLNTNLERNVEFGISPAGGWAAALSSQCPAPYGQPGGMTGISCYSYSSYVDLYADTRKWVQEEWIDYILPQNYGSFYAQNHKPITSWWANEVKNKNVKLYMGLAPYQYNSYNGNWAIPDMDDQMNYGYSFDTLDGFAMYNISNLKTATNENMRIALNNLKEKWSEPAFLPMKNRQTIDTYTKPKPTINRSNHLATIEFAPHEEAYAYAVYQVEKDKEFIPENEKAINIIYPSTTTQSYTYDVERIKGYDFYIKTLYKDGYYGLGHVKLTIEPYTSNIKPIIKNLKLETDLLVLEGKTWLNISGEVFDGDGDPLTVTIQISNKVLTDVKIKDIKDEFSYDYYIPDLNFTRTHFKIIVSDGIGTTTARTFSFYVPKRNYSTIMQHIMTIEIITNDFIENIYK